MRLLFFFIWFLTVQNTFAQSKVDEKIKWYALAKPTTNLFVHFDKNVYSNNETVYFTGYIVKDGRVPLAMHKVMAVALIREVDSALIAEDKFIMSKGISFGSLSLPDSIPTGNYRLLAYTDKLVNKVPELLFAQPITIKSSIEPSFNANVKLIEQGDKAAKTHKILVSAATKEGRFLMKPTKITYRYGKIMQSVFTDASSQSIITLPVQTDITDPNVYLKLSYDQDSTFISIGLPLPKNKAIVKFYPEGGNMVNGLTSIVNWEVKDMQNRPLTLKAFLYKNSKVIDTIETGSYGIGNFKLKPERGNNYSVKLLHSNLIDSSYYLPEVLDKGLTLAVQNALVKDTLIVNLKTLEKSKLNLLIHNFNSCFLNVPFTMGYESMRLKLPLDDIPKGLNTLTILDSLNRPLAERIFFAHYSSEDKIALGTDKEIYSKREKVNLKLNLKHEEALVSIAVVQDNRLELKKTNDIENYTYILNAFNALPINSKGRPLKDQNYLEQVLAVKGWRKYTWQQLMVSQPIDTVSIIDSLKISGQVSALKKSLKAPFIIGTMGSKDINLLPTSHTGTFSFENGQLMTPVDKKMYVFVNGGKKIASATKVKISDDFFLLNQTLSKIVPNEQPILPSTLVNNAQLLLKNNEKTIRLKEVVITKASDNSFVRSGANECGDFVCPYNILNCRNHIGNSENTEPIKGKSYIITSGFTATTVYEGCSVPDKNLFTLVKGIHAQKEFYDNDYKDLNEPAFFSTIYWNYGTLLSAKKETELSFYTSDITGKFRVVVQGISNRDVVYGEHYFEVKEKVN